VAIKTSLEPLQDSRGDRLDREDAAEDRPQGAGTDYARSIAMRTALIIALAGVLVSGSSSLKDFEKSWIGRRVVVRTPLYSLVYKELAMRGSVDARRDGLTVVTPSAGTYFQFDGRRKVDDIVEHDVQRIAPSVTDAYQQSKVFDVGFKQVIEPVMIARYDPGTALIVRDVRVTLDRVRIELSMPEDAGHELATALTVQWPAPLSKSFTERANVEALITRFLSTGE
jgi:hypothetical protein